MSEISTGYPLPTTDKEWRELARSVLDRKPSNPASFVGAAILLARFVEDAMDHRADVLEAIRDAASAQPEAQPAAVVRALQIAERKP